jgi:phosphoribosylanthranilate isomerase
MELKMKPKLKLNHIKDLHDARYCAAIGIDLLGFHLEENEEYSIAPKAVAEIMEWLSGPEGVGEFGYEAPDHINALMEAAKLQWTSIPIDYSPDDAADLRSPLVFRGPADLIEEASLKHLEGLAARFPDALFELSLDPKDKQIREFLSSRALMGRCILRFAQPSPIYSLLEKEGHPPYAFSLGAFVEEPDGAVDYESCDDFVEQYAELTPA